MISGERKAFQKEVFVSSRRPVLSSVRKVRERRPDKVKTSEEAESRRCK